MVAPAPIRRIMVVSLAFTLCATALRDISSISHNVGIDGRRNDYNATTSFSDDILDLSPLFSLARVSSSVFNGKRLKCCCKDEECVVADLDAENTCDGSSFRDRNGCGCLVSYGFRSYTHAGQLCLMTAEKASGLGFSPSELDTKLERAQASRYYGDWEVSYGACSVSCGSGVRSKANVVCGKLDGSCGEEGTSTSTIPDKIPCTEYKGCSWQCQSSSCGWGTVRCSGGERYCNLAASRLVNFQSKKDFLTHNCFTPCSQEDSLKTMCAITANHLDEQYQMRHVEPLENLMLSTCLADPNAHPDLLIVMAQELNHANKVSSGTNDFPTYVNRDSIPGYDLVGQCAPAMSANSAVYVRLPMSSRILPNSVECSGTKLISKCDWTNCKGNAVMGLTTSSGKLIVGNWHGDRRGPVSEPRIEEFEKAAQEILSIQPYRGRKLVVWGGDTNVRSDFGGDADLTIDASENTILPEAISARMRGGDFIGRPGWTVDEHLRGEVGLSDAVKTGLRGHPLRQVRDILKLCPTYRKSRQEYRTTMEEVWDGTWKTRFGIRYSKNMVMREKKRYNLLCQTPADQMPYGAPQNAEYIDMKRVMNTKKSRAPSWADRIFVSDFLYDGCGKAKKDIRNKQSDHDPVYVECNIPFTTGG